MSLDIQQDPIAQRFRVVQRENPDVTAALVFDSRARVQSSGGDERLVTSATALMTPVRDLVERAVAELGCGNLSTMMIEGSDAALALADVDGDRAVVVLGEPGGALGSLLADARHLAAQLRGDA